jgi:hypothetical protein
MVVMVMVAMKECLWLVWRLWLAPTLGPRGQDDMTRTAGDDRRSRNARQAGRT